MISGAFCYRSTLMYIEDLKKLKMMNNNEYEQAVFIDFDGHKQDELIQYLLTDLHPLGKTLRIIGSYTKF